MKVTVALSPEDRERIEVATKIGAHVAGSLSTLGAYILAAAVIVSVAIVLSRGDHAGE